MNSTPRVPYFIDEISITGLALVFFLGAMQFTWVNVSLELGLRGLFFMSIAGAGMTMYGLSGRANATILFLQWKRFIIAVILIIAGIFGTAVLQSIIIQFPMTVLASIPENLRLTYLLEAALSETYFVFGMYSMLAGRVHPILGFIVIGFTTPFLHLYVYGTSVEVLWAVSASFVLQAVLFEYSRLFSVPLLVHIGVNLL